MVVLSARGWGSGEMAHFRSSWCFWARIHYKWLLILFLEKRADMTRQHRPKAVGPKRDHQLKRLQLKSRFAHWSADGGRFIFVAGLGASPLLRTVGQGTLVGLPLQAISEMFPGNWDGRGIRPFRGRFPKLFSATKQLSGLSKNNHRVTP